MVCISPQLELLTDFKRGNVLLLSHHVSFQTLCILNASNHIGKGEAVGYYIFPVLRCAFYCGCLEVGGARDLMKREELPYVFALIMIKTWKLASMARCNIHSTFTVLPCFIV
ncbi:hypothetical protein PVAP13_3KG207717 [Panicum virgatum]|uniref:Uncharacterized protein n=1 Tax=Panicum virgatum TaxID=38727 RepID=A0A8T0UTJ5_PANVG|nr:hypothetical protein PVAP13_3KG207717 [Panicum virgatum]KAG2625457.1 hypothetical protein PVAP13_3KG207717 [Panicum virgatum]KAG2625458.1 hypothetical protein PVAP13_3KG207717 [Panicum virgatum]KAG2625459.1 hypothetical protein PVAP13_3KG207717 [Panicum virgatum]